MKLKAGLMLLVLVLVPVLFAQSSPSTATITKVGTPGDMTAKGPMIAMRTEIMDTAPVQGSPFCATVVNEHNQMFADGNKIHTTENSALCRDGQGRTRRESQLNLLGAVPQGDSPKFITIVDPVAKVRYVLDTRAKVARKSSLAAGAPMPPPGGMPKSGQNVMIYNSTGGPAGAGGAVAGQTMFVRKTMMHGDQPPADSESLGDQMINGIHATGTRMTTTIAAGKMGNEQPINVVSEEWYSPELKTMMRTKHTDPWAGELTTQLTNVNTSEPDASLFLVPSDYKVIEDGAEPFMLKLQPPEPPK